MTAQVIFFNSFSEKDPHFNAVEFSKNTFTFKHQHITHVTRHVISHVKLRFGILSSERVHVTQVTQLPQALN